MTGEEGTINVGQERTYAKHPTNMFCFWSGKLPNKGAARTHAAATLVGTPPSTNKRQPFHRAHNTTTAYTHTQQRTTNLHHSNAEVYMHTSSIQPKYPTNART
ncbi:unnamed protein product [Ectocarpus sp. 12 AP-2014]